MKAGEMEIKEGVILGLDFNNDGGTNLKIYNRKDDGSIEVIEGAAVEEYVTKGQMPEDNDPRYGKMEFKNTVTIKAFSASPLKVYVDTGTKVYCYLVDRNTGKILGRC